MSDEDRTQVNQRNNDVCPECGCIGTFRGCSIRGGPSVGLGAPDYVEHWECMAENCDTEWTA